MTEFMHIAPTAYLPAVGKIQKRHLVLAHLVENDPEYRQFYADLPKLRDGVHDGHMLIMDNGMFEAYKQGFDIPTPDKLVELAKDIGADYAVLPDYPGQPAQVTIDAAYDSVGAFKKAGLKTFFVPQGRVGDIDDLLKAFEWAINQSHSLVDYIGVSILAAPLAFNVESNNKLQRYVSRNHLLRMLFDKNLLQKTVMNDQRIHLLGMLDGPNEIMLNAAYSRYINTWDSSAAFWYGYNGIRFDQSPTGAINGKFELEVDFNAAVRPEAADDIAYNVSYISAAVRHSVYNSFFSNTSVNSNLDNTMTSILPSITETINNVR